MKQCLNKSGVTFGQTQDWHLNYTVPKMICNTCCRSFSPSALPISRFVRIITIAMAGTATFVPASGLQLHDRPKNKSKYLTPNLDASDDLHIRKGYAVHAWEEYKYHL